jgi:hypothetical protein
VFSVADVFFSRGYFFLVAHVFFQSRIMFFLQCMFFFSRRLIIIFFAENYFTRGLITGSLLLGSGVQYLWAVFFCAENGNSPVPQIRAELGRGVGR